MASIALFSMMVDGAKAADTHETHARQTAPKIGSLVVGRSKMPEAKPSNGVHMNDTIRNPQRHLTPAQWAAEQVSPAERRAWDKVNICEESGDWHVSGSTYSGGLGITNVNWVAYGGKWFAPTADKATPDEQIVIAERIQPDPPDQNGCDPGGW